MKKRVLYIDYLDITALIIGLFLKPFFFKIYFRNAQKIFQTKKRIVQLEKIGIYWLSYQDIPTNIYFSIFHNFCD